MTGISGTRLAVLKGLPKSSIGAELGVYKGGLSAAILAELKRRALHFTDPWQYRIEVPYERAMYEGAKGRDPSKCSRAVRQSMSRWHRADPA